MAAVRIGRLRDPEREAHVRALLARWAVSGASKVAFCRSEGITTVNLTRRTKEFGAAARPAAAGRFIEVRLDPASGTPRGFEVELGQGRRLRIPPGLDAGDLCRLLAVLGRTPC